MYEQTNQWANSDPALFFIAVLVLFVIHFTPSFVAYSRGHASRLIILILNILMGWTVIGWALLLYWSAKGQTKGLLA